MALISLQLKTPGLAELTRKFGSHASLSAAMARMVADIGAGAHRDILGPLEAQSGLHGYGRIARAVHDEAGNLTFALSVRGGNISLKYFDHREVAGGVMASPRNVATFYGGAFTRSGLPGRRYHVSRLNKQVYQKVTADGRWGGKIKKLRSGVFLAEELVKGKTLAAFMGSVERTFEAELPKLLAAII